MKYKITLSIAPVLCGLLLSLLGFHSTADAQRRVVVRRPLVRPRLVVRPAHPIRRALPAAVVVRHARRTVIVGHPLVFLPRLAWTPRVVTLPASDRLLWQDSEKIASDEGWVDSNFGVDSAGKALFLQIDGKAELNFAEVVFANGSVQVVDFDGRTHATGIYALLDFPDGRHVKTVRLLARSAAEETLLAVYLSK